MSDQPGPGTVEVTVVHSPACHLCDDAVEALAAIGADADLDVSVVALESTAGAALAALHRPAMYPLVLVEGAFFSSGRLPRKKLVRLLEARRAARPAAAGR